MTNIATLDFDRFRRRGYPEAVLCLGKTTEQVAEIARTWRDKAEGSDEPLGPVLFTRASAEQLEAVRASFVLPGDSVAGAG